MDRNTLLPAGFSDKIFPRSQKNSLIIEKIINFKLSIKKYLIIYKFIYINNHYG